jgi:hypothetical protein|tara:strand:- start:672 stop:866 length:195 start_codon:yes stop_codon:yes gene_type:complete
MNEMILILSVKAILITLIVLIYRNKKLKKREFEEQLKQSKHVTEREKIRVYIDKINEATRAKHR